ncbi:MAG: hypothetical protein ACM3YO_02695 [Bacteroidota bacterium]
MQNENQEFVIYRYGLAWSEAATTLTKLLNQGGSLDEAGRKSLQVAHESCLWARREILEDTEIGMQIHRVIQPLYRRESLLTMLDKADEYLLCLFKSPAALESVTLDRPQLAWLVETLSDLCILLLREIATRRLAITV